MIEFYKEKVKTNLELLKIVASGITVSALIGGNIVIKDNFGENSNQYIVFSILLAIILIGLGICYKFYDRINLYLNKIEDYERNHQS